MLKLPSTGSRAPSLNLLFTAELVAVYGFLAWAGHQWTLPPTLFFLLLPLAGLIFALYYGVKGAVAAALTSLFTVVWVMDEPVAVFLSRYYSETGFFIAALLLAGLSTSGMANKVVSATLSNDILNRRLEKLTVELSEKDRALQEALREALTDMESPRIIYQALRRIEKLVDRQSLFDEILNVFYTHCHVEKSSIFESVKGQGFVRVAVFGPTALPATLDWASPQMPEILRVVKVQREVIVPVRLDHRLVMAIPLLSMDDVLRYVILIEEVRFINFNDNLINLLKVTAHWARYLIELRLRTDELAPLSVFATVIAFKPELAAPLLERDIATHRRYGLDFALLQVDGPVDEDRARRIGSQLRLYDDMYITHQGHAIILLSMIAPRFIPAVIKRLARNLPQARFTVIEPDRWRDHVR